MVRMRTARAMWLATTFMAGCAMVEQPPSTGDCCKTAGRIGLVSNTRVCENCPCDTAPPPVAQPEPQTFIVHYRVNHPCLVLSSRREVDQAVAYMRSHPASTATINGYTDGSGAERKRQEWLSHRRALVVARYMVRKGIGQDRLTVKGNGDSKPVADNRTEAGRARNRRVEIVVD